MNMFSLKAANIYDVVSPLHISSQLMGLTSFSIRNEKGIFVESVTWFNLLCLLLSALNYFSITVWFISQVQPVWDAKNIEISDVFQSSIFCVQTSYMIILLSSNFWFFSRRKKFCVLLNLILEVDEELDKLNVPLDHRKHKKIILCFVVLNKILTAACLYSVHLFGDSLNVYAPNIFSCIMMFICIETSVYLLFHLTFWMSAVKLRYEKINFFLRENFLTKANSYEDGNKNLNSAARLHDKLVDVSECVNRCYGIVVS